MSPVRLALAQVNPTVGDLDGNAAIVRDYVARAAQAEARIVAFPEMMLTGYPVEDLALRATFQQASAAQAQRLAAELRDGGYGHLFVVVGLLDAANGRPANAAVVMHSGEIVARYVKHRLPNYGVFDEHRWFAAGDQPCVITVDGVAISLAICEDIWQSPTPALVAAQESADVLLVINASPYERGKYASRVELCRQRGAETGCTVAYVNLVGGQDELVFDGGSVVVDASGQVLAHATRFTDDLVIVDIAPAAAGAPADAGGPTDAVSAVHQLEMDPTAEIYTALVIGLRDYVHKNGHSSVVLGCSGGIDSALVATIACDALGANNVFGVSMPSVYSSQHSRDDAFDLAQRSGLALRTIPIAAMVDAYQDCLHVNGVAAENLQARVRGITLMAISNSEGHLVLATGNKSELAVGYSTIYGDAVGGFGPIKDVPKTLVWELALWRNTAALQRGETAPIPPSSIEKPPSAELRPDQLDSDSLPDYPQLDAILAAYIESDTIDLVAAGFDPELARRVMSLTDGAEYKRRQYPPGTKITTRAFGRDRRLPITNHWREVI